MTKKQSCKTEPPTDLPSVDAPPPPPKRSSKVEPPKRWPEPPQATPKPKPRPLPDTNGCDNQCGCGSIELDEWEIPTGSKRLLRQHIKQLHENGRIDDIAFGQINGLVENYNPPRQPHACTCSQQQGQPRPFVRINHSKGATVISLSDFVCFQVIEKSLQALTHIGSIIGLFTFTTTEQALIALDTIQAAIEHCNRAAAEKRCTCGDWQHQPLTIAEQKEIKSYIRWRYGNAPEPDWGNIAMWIVELEMCRPESPIYCGKAESDAP